jgi:hypothetical protein
MKLFLDDFREPVDVIFYTEDESLHSMYVMEDWHIVRSYSEFVKFIQANGLPELISFDHDLTEEHYSDLMYATDKEYNALYKTFKDKTGFQAAKWLKRYIKKNNLPVPEIHCHSRNPIGKKNILKVFA